MQKRKETAGEQFLSVKRVLGLEIIEIIREIISISIIAKSRRKINKISETMTS
ncbi:MAG: hypothetical protein U0M70_04880 [Eubacteriales bacterium]